MIEKLKQLFALKQQEEDPAQTEKAIQLACLVMMIETGKADHSLDDREMEIIRRYAIDQYGIESNIVDGLIDQAKDQAAHATSLYEFTSLINEHFDEPQKFRVVQSMWRVAYADGQIDRYEEHIIRRAADLLYVDHPRFIEAKLSVQPKHSN